MISQLLATDVGLKNAALAQFNNVAKSMDAQKYDVAQNQAGALINFLLKQSSAGKLSPTTDVFGGTTAPLSADQALSQLIAAIYSFLHVPGTDLTKIDAAAAFVAHDAPETLVKTGTGLAAVRIPTGALGGDALVTITPISYLAYAPGDGPLFAPGDPTKVPEYPYYYEISAYAVGSDPIASPFNSQVLVEICQIETGPYAPADAIHSRLQLAHKTATGVEFVPREYAPDLACTPTVPVGTVGSLDRPMESEGFLAMGMWQLRTLPSRALDALSPKAAFAGHGGLGGLTSSFSPWAAVDQGPFPITLAPTSVPAGGSTLFYPVDKSGQQVRDYICNNQYGTSSDTKVGNFVASSFDAAYLVQFVGVSAGTTTVTMPCTRISTNTSQLVSQVVTVVSTPQ